MVSVLSALSLLSVTSATSAGSTTPARSCQNLASRVRHTSITTTPMTAMPIPITRGGPTPNQAWPL